jgi:two-component system sensor histidine kinase DesK
MRDVENAAREALREAREAIASYRQPTLAGELQGAREMLSVAGIACICADQPAPLRVPTTLETTLAWTIREGVTNVIRHSRGARTCTIQIKQNTTHVNVSIMDDGHAITDTLHSTRNSTPHGLTGLAERVALYQGIFEAGPQPVGGFRLLVSLPLETPVQPAENVENDQPVQEAQQ